MTRIQAAGIRAAAVAFASLFPEIAGLAAGADNLIVVDRSTTYQTMTGWEATAWASQESPAFPNFKDELFDLAVHDLGINRVRLEVRAGAENARDYWSEFQSGQIEYSMWRSRRYSTVNDNGDPRAIDWQGFHFSELSDTVEKVVLPLKERVEANGEELFINLNYVAFTSQIDFDAGLLYLHDQPEEYAEFILAAFLHLEGRYGWAPDSVEVLLEPDNVSQWNGTLLGRAIVATAARLSENGFSPRFVAPSNTNMGNAVRYFDQMIAVPGALEHLDEFSYHRYGGVSDANLQAIVSRAVQRGLSTCMLEWWSGGNGYEVLHKDLEAGRNSAWQQAVVSGHYDIDESNPDSPTIRIKDKTKFTRQYFKFVRSGAVRVGATSSNAALDPLAFVNADGRYVVVVKADSGGQFSIQGLPECTYGIKYTTSSQYDVDLPDRALETGQALAASIPARGVITVYGKCEPAPPEARFRRGDANADGEADLSDAVHILNHLFTGGPEPSCLKSADANDDGQADVSDPVFLLVYLFSGGEAPGSPLADCGPDPTDDELTCRSHPPCE